MLSWELWEFWHCAFNIFDLLIIHFIYSFHFWDINIIFMTLNIILSMDCVSIKVEKLEICFVEFDNCHGGKWLIYIGITTNITWYYFVIVLWDFWPRKVQNWRYASPSLITVMKERANMYWHGIDRILFLPFPLRESRFFFHGCRFTLSHSSSSLERSTYPCERCQ